MTTNTIALERRLSPPASSEELSGVSLDLEVTSVCDAVCGFCPREFMPDKRSFIAMDLIDRLAEDIQNRPGFSITLCGIGESTLHPHFNQIVRTLVDAGAKVDLTTNGGRMNTDKFEEYATLGLAEIHFSLNAITAPTHAAVMKMKNYDKIVDNVQQILKLKHRSYPYTHVHVSFVICKGNEHEIDDFVDFWKPQNPSGIWLHPLNNRGGLLNPEIKMAGNMETLKKKYEGDDKVLVDVFGHVPVVNNVCKVARAMMFISVEGEMRLCAMDYKRTTSYGNLRNVRLHEMHIDKLARYSRGEMNALCHGCDFCPEGISQKRMPAHA
jgi:MoaA/NifB/PqqE/SkfB family radical SAM enzyme